MNLIESIDRWGVSASEKIAHLSGDQSLTYGELVQRSNSLAVRLTEILPANGAPIAVQGHKEPEMLVAFLGAIKSGHPYIPIDISIPSQRVTAILETAQVSLVLTPEKVNDLLAEASASSYQASSRLVSPGDPWYIMFTSGSTGEPKGVVITRACLESFVAWMLTEQGFAARGEVFLNQAPFSFDLSVMDLYGCLATGGTLFSITQEQIAEPRLLHQALGKSSVNVWVSTPSFAQLCLAEPTFSAQKMPGLRKFLFCGETLAPEVAAELLARFPRAEVWNTYGPTEATVATTSVQIDRTLLERYSLLPVGYPKPDGRILIVDPKGNPLPDGERGEILIAGTNVSPGYLNRPNLTARAFGMLGPLRTYRTGDLGHFQDGLLFFDGRMDHQIKLHGYRIELGDVEANLQALPDIRDAVVVPALKDGKPEYLIAFIILKNHSNVSDFETTRQLKRLLSQRLPGYMVPRKFIFMDRYPMTVNGKADRRQLAASYR